MPLTATGRLAVLCRAELPRNLSAPGQARQLTSRWLEHVVCEEDLQTAKLVVSELISNAIQHGSGRIWLVVDADANRVRIEVIDQGTGFAHEVREVPFQQAGGRGLRIVDTTISRWGIYEGTTHVWAEIEREGPRLQAPEEPDLAV